MSRKSSIPLKWNFFPHYVLFCPFLSLSSYRAFGIYFAMHHEVKMFGFSQFLTNCFVKYYQITPVCQVLSVDSQQPYLFLCILYTTTAGSLKTTFPRGPCQLILVSANGSQSHGIDRWEKCKNFLFVATVSAGVQTSRLLVVPPSLF